MSYEREPEPETPAPLVPNVHRSLAVGTRAAALCRSCGAVIVTTPINAEQYWTPDPQPPRDPCPHCTATSWRPCVVHRLRVEIPAEGA